MTPSQASVLIGCTPRQVRHLCRLGRLGRLLKTDDGPRYIVSQKEAEAYRDLPRGRGRPRTKPQQEARQ